MDFAQTLMAVRALSVEERLRLVAFIWNELTAEDAIPEPTNAQRAELERRWQDDEVNPDNGTPWEEIREAARARA